MSRVRQPVEWVFGACGLGLKSKFATLEMAHLMRLKGRPVGDYAQVAALLCNMMVCQLPESSQTFRFFERAMPPPSLICYLHGDAYDN